MLSEMLNPDLFHGHIPWNKYEGWYFKISDKSENSFAIIPGIFLDKGDPHVFIQILISKNNFYQYFRMPFESFKSNKAPFLIKIIDNSFSFQGISARLKSDFIDFRAELSFSNGIPWNPDAKSHRSMGYYNFIPFMECYSQVCYMDLEVNGYIKINNTTYFIEKGKCYIEKNWGNAFPYSWIWIQSNNFFKGETSFTSSIAHIPFPMGSFRGFLIGLYHKGSFYSFTTMNKSKIRILKAAGDVKIEVENKKFLLKIFTESNKDSFILCKAPKEGRMIDLVRETLTAKVFIKLIDKASDKVILEDTGYNSGIEYGGDQMKILDLI